MSGELQCVSAHCFEREHNKKIIISFKTTHNNVVCKYNNFNVTDIRSKTMNMQKQSQEGKGQ